MKKKAKKVLVLSLAMLFFILGLLGLVLPFLQGILFLAISALLFSMYLPRLRHWIQERTEPYPVVHREVLRAERWVVKVFGAPEV